MPKMKTHTGMGKRFKVTGTGKLVPEQAGKRHNLEQKSSTPDPPADRHGRGRQGRRQAHQEAARPLTRAT